MGRAILLAVAMLALAGLLAAPATAQQPKAQPYRPLVIGHRGAAGHLPEHTLESYALAIELGADLVEPDLVFTKDGVFITRHENELSGTTDVAEKFPGRRTRKEIDGVDRNGWFSEDFTLAEIKTLRARERLPFRDHSHDGQYGIVTFEELIALVERRQKELGRSIGIIPELKHAMYFASIGKPMAAPLVKILKAHGLDSAEAPVFIQSFETTVLRELHGMTRARLVQLIGVPYRQPYDFIVRNDPRTFADMATRGGLEEIARYAQAIGPNKRHILPRAPDRTLKPPTTLVRDAHRAGLLVFPYTFRSEPRYLSPDYEGDPVREYLRFFELKVDGVFTDVADVAVKARGRLAAK